MRKLDFNSDRQISACAILLAVGMFSGAAAIAQPAGYNYDEAKVPSYELPPVLTAGDGTSVATPEQWQQQRRPEILSLFEQHVFGKLPDRTSQLLIRQRSRVDNAFDGKAVRREITVYFSGDDSGPSMDMLVYTPANADRPVPCFLGLNFNGNHTVDPDPAIHMTESWVRNDQQRGNIDHRATEKSRGSSSSRWPAEMIVSGGYGLATIYYGDIDPDFDDGFRNGIHALTEGDRGDNKREPDAGGSISAWAWGLSHALDVLITDPLVDGDRVAVFGHSRLGKTSLWAGATDPRFALVISNNSGCGGAALSRRRFGETVKRINTSFPHWFCLNHRTYNDNEDALPVDHHMLMALIAPRPVYVASAVEDQWADPRGELLSLYHASPVYELLGKKGLPADELPELNEPVQTDVGYHIRRGKHDVTDFDWQQYLKFADAHLR
ncbi:MAG: acetylxylan esterase [Fuerstiella sp.]